MAGDIPCDEEVLLEGAKPKVAPALADPALERERLAFEMKNGKQNSRDMKLSRRRGSCRRKKKNRDGRLSKRKGDCRGKKI